MKSCRIVLCLVLLLAASCGEDDPDSSSGDVTDDAVTGAACSPAPDYQEDVSGCTPLATDYLPRENGSADDDWPACISDDDTWHRVEESISSIARVQAYGAIGELLWANASAPTHEDFLAARIMFEEEQGIGSRVARRYDVHYDKPDEGGCEDEGVTAAYPDYCVGPATIQPTVVAAFADGAAGHNRIRNAVMVEAALQWFLYVSAVKEATTCTDKAKDCDSSWAYYTGGTPREAPIGLAADIDAVAPETHDRAYDGVLAVRCWRDLDPEDTATDLALRDQAIAQLDTALLRGMSILIRQRFLALECATGDHQAAHLEALRFLVPLFDRATRERDSAVADTLLAEVSKSADAIDVDAVVDALDATYPCP